MILMYYTGAAGLDQPQTSPELSLGGWKSNTVIPNGLLGSLFSDVSQTETINGAEQIIAVVLKNESTTAKMNLSIFSSSIDGTMFLASAVTLSNGAMEKIQNNKSLPYVGNLVNITGEANKRILISNLLPQQSIGLWLKRIVAPVAPLTCDQLYAKYKAEGLAANAAELLSATFTIEWQ